MKYRISTSDERARCTTQLAKLNFNHSTGRTHSWRFSIFNKNVVNCVPVGGDTATTTVVVCVGHLRTAVRRNIWKSGWDILAQGNKNFGRRYAEHSVKRTHSRTRNPAWTHFPTSIDIPGIINTWYRITVRTYCNRCPVLYQAGTRHVCRQMKCSLFMMSIFQGGSIPDVAWSVYIPVYKDPPPEWWTVVRGWCKRNASLWRRRLSDNRPEGRVMQRVRMKEHMKRMLRRLLRRGRESVPCNKQRRCSNHRAVEQQRSRYNRRTRMAVAWFAGILGRNDTF